MGIRPTDSWLQERDTWTLATARSLGMNMILSRDNKPIRAEYRGELFPVAPTLTNIRSWLEEGFGVRYERKVKYRWD